MTRLLYVPQYPTKMRYQEWWWRQFKKAFEMAYDQVIVLGEQCLKDSAVFDSKLEGNFSDLHGSLTLEMIQSAQYLGMVQDDDILFVSDISYPGFFCSSLFHKRPKKMFGFAHATAINNLDYFKNIANEKFAVECAHMKLFDKIFVATEYHKKKLNDRGIMNVVSLGALPDHDFQHVPDQIKKRNLVSVMRLCNQKVDLDIEEEIVREFRMPITRNDFKNWGYYYSFLETAEIMLITSKEETYGYTVVDAIRSGCIPLAPRDYSYPELIPDEFLYSDIGELKRKIKRIHNDTEYKLPRAFTKATV